MSDRERDDFTREEHEWLTEKVFALWNELLEKFEGSQGAQCSAALTIAANMAAMALDCVKDEAKPRIRRQFIETWNTAEEYVAKKTRHLKRR